VGDGKLNVFRGFEYSYSTLKVFDDQNMEPLETWHPRIENVVYYGMVCFFKIFYFIV
jgi:isopenicillin-N N-acyltransferase like protein